MGQHTKTLVRARQVLTMASPGGLLRTRPDPAHSASIRDRDDAIVGIITDGAVLIEDDRIAWVGPQDAINSADPRFDHVDVRLDADLVTPGWIDCHTHAVFAGSRSDEFVLRNLGAKYGEILAAGGGIHNTVAAVRAASTRALAADLVAKCMEATRIGITTMEVKSGYGLSKEDEIKELRAVSMAREDALLTLEPTFLGAHVVPKKYAGDRERYLDLVCEEMIPSVAEQGLARFCDVFCDVGVFSPAEAERILRRGLDHGLIPKLHADELGAAGAAEVAAEVGAASADHLDYVSDAAIAAMATADVVAVMLPAVNLFLGTRQIAPARRLLEAGVDVAVSTDYNPGSAMTHNLATVVTLACTMMAMTPGESLVGVTRAAAKALRVLDDRGTLEVGKRADLTLLRGDYWEIPYDLGANHVEGVIRDGTLVYWLSTEEVVDEP